MGINWNVDNEKRDNKGRFIKGNHIKTEFKKGFSPWNKGKKGIHLSYKTEFQKGHTSWNDGISMVHKGSFKDGHKQSNTGRTHFKKNDLRISRENNPNWKGGISPLNELLRKSSVCKIWRETCKIRDNFTCQNPNCEYCHNQEGMILHVHHIKSFAEYPELRFVISNGITYCVEFHINSKELHKGILKERINGN